MPMPIVSRMVDRCDAFRRDPLPDALPVQELGAARTDRVDPRIPCGVLRRIRGDDDAAVEERNGQPRARERGGKRKADEARACVTAPS